jgi:hypothetical protein
LSTVVRHGSSDGAWKAMPEIFSGPVTGAPSMRILPIVGHLQAGGQLHEGRLAAARRADDGDEFALLGLQVDGLDGEVVLASNSSL